MSKFAAGGNSRRFTKFMVGTAVLALAVPGVAHAQDQQGAADSSAEAGEDIIVVTGIRSSLQSALGEKRNAESLVEVIQAEDIGKLPDQNLAEVLENVTGVQITRRAGVGSGVQIRGTNDNRVEINGVGTVGSGTGRGGISFEDINAAIIASVEVTKAPTAATTEGSVGGTVNLRTIRPLDLSDRVLTFRAQGEYSELSDSVTPRFSGSFGDNWDVGGGRIGLVLAASYAEQEATSFRPRVDRDTLIETTDGGVTAAGAPGPNFDYLGIQFLNQELENFEYETINFSGTLEFEPSDNLNFFFDMIYNDQERRQDSSRIQGSGVSSLRFNNVPDTFETVNFGSLSGVNLGSIEAALTGTIQPNLARDDDDPNLRFSSDTGARLTTTQVYRLGTEWETGDLTVRVEGSITESDTTNPNLSTTLNFINPNPLTPLDGVSNDNSVPFIYDLSGGALTFGVDFASPFAPTVADLLNPANTVLDAITASRNATENREDAARIDLSYDTYESLGFITSVDVGYRYNKTSTRFDQIRSTFGTGAIANSPSGSLFAGLLVPGPNNFDAADGRTLAFRNFLVVDPDAAFDDPDGTLDTLQAALATTNGSINDPSFDPTASFEITEKTHALYGQLNFEFGPVRGNVGARWVDTSIQSLGNGVAAGVVTPLNSTGSYSEFMPRINVIADVSDDIVFRASFGEDINRPDFNDLSLSVNFPTGPNNAVNIGNPNLAPETVTSYDASLSWYFAPAAVFSVGVFHKDRTNLFVTQEEAAALDANGFRDITDPCEGGGIFNPLPDRNVLSNVPGNGLCVPIQTIVNDPGTTSQTGIEVAFQYDLSSFEDTLGFASGFGVIANYTYQEFSGGTLTNTSDADSRGTEILESSSGLTGPFTRVQGLLDFSPHAYNATLFYDKYGLSARLRYTWRDAFRTLDTAAGASLGSTIGFPVVTESRGQLNGSINYDVTDNINIGVEGVNLTKSKITQSCVNSGALLCFQGLPDRRITFGASVSF
ncbi:TonB-dependent receptor [Pontixanthobacter sp. CEM42]|uniref:TonB-dependent receptor n=1 Tax=Pontixanthobacter sp. CEM42 TaxID=2792077 RepID=UPI001ADF3FBD|nr:TonB-dependent receptor [Pontixanthobacter sp. CEM42]